MDEIIYTNDHFEVRAVLHRQLYEVINLRSGILEETTNSEYAAMAYAVRAKHAIEQLASNEAAMSWPDPDDAEPSKH